MAQFNSGGIRSEDHKDIRKKVQNGTRYNGEKIWNLPISWRRALVKEILEIHIPLNLQCLKYLWSHYDS